MCDLTQPWVSAIRDGRYELAWALSEQALAARDPGTRNDRSVPYHLRWIWDGRPFDGRDILVRCYHGLGDTIQFARYLPRLASRAASLTVEVQPRLCGLLAELPGVECLIPFDAVRPVPESDCDMEITELAFALREPPSVAPPPYLHAPRASLPPAVIGICHAAGDWDNERCIPADLFRSLCFSRTCLTLASQPSDLPVLNPEGCPFDMATTASLVAAVDLVVTVDTMIAHLAGAMGRPTWLLVKADPDWRWSPHATRSAWYPSMRIYAQPKPGNWSAVLDQVEHDLAAIDFKGAERRVGQ